MPTLSPCSIDSISLFSGCGGLDIGFERAGFKHVLSLDILDICGETLKFNRPSWKVLAGKNKGDIRNIEWEQEVKNKDNLLVIHGGPPCQPFSNSGRQLGEEDERNMVPEFFRAVNKLLPDAFIMENVPALKKAFLNEIDYNQQPPSVEKMVGTDDSVNEYHGRSGWTRDLAFDQLGWTHSTSLDDGLHVVFNWINKNLSQLATRSWLLCIRF